MNSEQAAFGERLRAALDRARMAHSATDLARLVQQHGAAVSTQAVQKWIRGQAIARGANLRALAKALRVPADRLYPGTQMDATAVRDARSAYGCAEDQELFARYLALPDRHRQLVRDMIDVLSQSGATGGK